MAVLDWRSMIVAYADACTHRVHLPRPRIMENQVVVTASLRGHRPLTAFRVHCPITVMAILLNPADGAPHIGPLITSTNPAAKTVCLVCRFGKWEGVRNHDSTSAPPKLGEVARQHRPLITTIQAKHSRPRLAPAVL